MVSSDTVMTRYTNSNGYSKSFIVSIAATLVRLHNLKSRFSNNWLMQHTYNGLDYW